MYFLLPGCSRHQYSLDVKQAQIGAESRQFWNSSSSFPVVNRFTFLTQTLDGPTFFKS